MIFIHFVFIFNSNLFFCIQWLIFWLKLIIWIILFSILIIFPLNLNKAALKSYGLFGRQAVFNGCSSESQEPEPADGRIRLGPCLNGLPVFRVGMPGMVAVVAAKKIGRKVLTKFSANVISVI